MRGEGIPGRRSGRNRVRKIDTSPLLPFTYGDDERTIPLDRSEPPGLFAPAPEARCDRRVDASSTPSNSSVPAVALERGRSVDLRELKALEIAARARIS